MKQEGWSVQYWSKAQKKQWHHVPNSNPQLVAEVASLLEAGGTIIDFRWFGKTISAIRALKIVNAASVKSRSN